MNKYNVDMRGKNVIVTGANTGLGYVKAREIAKMGGSVTMACRSAERGQAALEKMREEALEKPVKEGVPLREDITDVDIKLEALDLGSLKSIQDFSKRVKASGSKIDILINNAGVMAIPDRRETADGFEMTVGINHIGTHFLTRLLEPCLADGGRVIFYSSIGHNRPPGQPKTTFNWDDINAEKPGVYRQWMSYGQSKLYNLLDAQEFAKHLSGRGITTYAVSPGVVMTELTRNMTDNSMMSVITRMMSPLMKYLISTPLQGSLTAMRCACDPTVGTPELSGKYWHNEKETKPSDLACDPANAPRLWKATEDMLEAKLGKPVSEFI
ncbi:unnamed protein product [Discosporangium mesarthrocarpum]